VTADTVLFGKYRLDRVIGKGRTGTVWLAVHLGLEEYRAIKQVSKAAVGYEVFHREALILKSLRHPAIPIVYDLEEDQNFLYLIQEYIKGESLYALVQSRGVMNEAEAVRYGVQICALVEFLHFAGEKPILFLDLQPKNLIICGGVVISDKRPLPGSVRMSLSATGRWAALRLNSILLTKFWIPGRMSMPLVLSSPIW
jgi:serine/threonine protein kinase